MKKKAEDRKTFRIKYFHPISLDCSKEKISVSKDIIQ